MIEEKLEKLINDIGFKLYGTESVVENDQKIYRVYILGDDKITLDDCQKVSQVLSPIFDIEPPISGNYFLEVSSPGLERKLSNPKQFMLSIGELIKFKTNESQIATLISADENGFEVEYEDGSKTNFSYEELKSCRTYIKW